MEKTENAEKTVGTIIKGIGGFYYVKTDDNSVYETHACGRFRKEKIIPLVGDRVYLTQKLDSICEILPRKSEFIRPPVANIDNMVVVMSASFPEANLRLTDTMLFYFESRGTDVVICINKSDSDSDGKAKKLSDIYTSAGYRVIITSAVNKMGKDELESVLKGKITAFAGSSGVGKSSLLNLVCKEYNLETGTLSSKTERGRHTTRHVELLELPFGGYVLDTPGFGKIDLPKITADATADYFREFKKYEGMCRFTGCTHTSERDCAVLEAAEKGEIQPSRMESYLAFFNELKENKAWQLR